MTTVYVRGTARLDLIDRYVYFAENASVEIAERFFVSAERSFEYLSRRSTIGAPLALSPPKLAGMRKWSVEGFGDVLIFYQPRPDGVSIVRVLHAAQDWWGMLRVVT